MFNIHLTFKVLVLRIAISDIQKRWNWILSYIENKSIYFTIIALSPIRHHFNYRFFLQLQENKWQEHLSNFSIMLAFTESFENIPEVFITVRRSFPWNHRVKCLPWIYPWLWGGKNGLPMDNGRCTLALWCHTWRELLHLSCLR